MKIRVIQKMIADAPDEVASQAYRLALKRGQLTLEAPTTQGIFYALQTLRQLLPTVGHECQEIEIIDWPAFPLRGFMHDTGRNYQEPALLKKQIEMFSRYKLNLFHFHFTDNPGWRLESKRHPELQADKAFSRQVGRFYTQKEFREILEFAKTRHVVVVPELDVPGHSAAFRRAYEISQMNSPGVRERLVDLIDELCGLAPKELMPYVHLGTDEVQSNERVPTEWLEDCVAMAHRHDRIVIGWNPGLKLDGKGPLAQQLWTGGSRPWPNRPYFDSQANYYLNHIDPFEMLSAMSFQQPCRWGEDAMKLGPIACIWHDDHARSGADVLLMNHVIPGLLLFSDNAWQGRPADEPEWWCRLPGEQPELMARAESLERRLITQRDRWFRNEPFPYVAQTALEWRVIGPFDHHGDPNKVFPPETEGVKPAYSIGGSTETWWPSKWRGATHYPQHFWYSSYLKSGGGTLYAFTRIWSPEDQDVGAWIGFNAWSRSAGRKRGGGTPVDGQWNRSGAAIWINSEALTPPKLSQPGVGGDASTEIPLVDEDYFYRDPLTIKLKKGWNTVLIKAPHAGQWKWVFTFIPVRPTGVGFNVTEVAGLRYSADFEGAEADEFAEVLAQESSEQQARSADDDAYGNAADFSKVPLGPLSTLASPLGNWSAENGHATIIDSSHGKRVLKLEGGQNRSVRLDLNDVEKLDGIRFELRRWTRNNPFKLRVDAQVDGVWKTVAELETASMDNQLEDLTFPAVEAKALRFELTSPDHGGAMINALRLRSASPTP